jgi:peptidoglycan hydrolase-like protein with peptidoglycan-binding domain
VGNQQSTRDFQYFGMGITAMKSVSQALTVLLGLKQNKPYFPGEKQVLLFTQRPVIYRDFAPKFVQDAINELQTILKDQDFVVNITGKFDSCTEEAVKEFQRKNHLYVDGIVGPLTWACLCYPKLDRNIRNPSLESENAVKEMQIILYKEELLKKQPNGYFDRQTEIAVKRFQRIYGLKDDGVVGAATWAVLLGMRQKREQNIPKLISFLPLQFVFLSEQFLMIVCILVGIYHSPLPGKVPTFNTALATAYGLTCIVPFLLEHMPLKHFNHKNLPLFQYAPYVLAGIFWKPLLNFVVELFK